MRNYILSIVILSLACMLAFPSVGVASWSIDIESGLATSGYNDVRIPGDVGTTFSLTDDLESDEVAFFRARLTVDVSERQRLSALVAPLRFNAAGTIGRDIDYNGLRFRAGEQISTRYRFDSYRVTYSYALVRTDGTRFDVGFTAKVRDAAIRVEGESGETEKSNTGFVPLIYVGLDWAWSSKTGMVLQADALAAPQGRAEDVLAAIYLQANETVRFRVGYRLLEGGADNDEVYNFTLVHYLSAGLTLTF